MTRRLHVNNFSTTLSTAIGTSTTSIVIASSTGLPTLASGEIYRITMTSGSKREIMEVTARSGTTLTVTRAQESTTAQVFPAGSLVEIRVTADSIDRKQDRVATSGDVIDFGDATTFEIPNSAAPTLNANGQIALDNTVTDYTNGLFCYRSGGVNYGIIALTLTDLTSPTNAYVVSYNATSDKFELVAQTGGGGSPGGSTTQVQYNNAGAFAGHSGFTYDGAGTVTATTGMVIGGNSTAAGYIRLLEDSDNGSNYTGFQAPSSLAANVMYTLPSADGTTGQVLSTNGSGTLSWATGGSGSPGGSTTQVQFNSAGSFSGDSGFTYAGSGSATLSTQLSVPSIVTASNSNLSLTPNGTGYVDMSSKTNMLHLPAGTTAQRPSTVTSGIRYNTSTARIEQGFSNTWRPVVISSDFGSAGLMTTDGVTTAPTYSVTALPLTVSNGGTGRNTSTTAYGVICAGTTATGALQTISSLGTSGQVLTSGGAGVLPSWQSVSGSITWNTASGTTQAAAVNNGYVCTNASQCNVTVPATAAVGDIVAVVSQGAGGIKVTANTGQTIKGLADTTTTAGSVTCAAQYDSIQVVCVVANTTWAIQHFTSSLLTFA